MKTMKYFLVIGLFSSCAKRIDAEDFKQLKSELALISENINEIDTSYIGRKNGELDVLLQQFRSGENSDTLNLKDAQKIDSALTEKSNLTAIVHLLPSIRNSADLDSKQLIDLEKSIGQGNGTAVEQQKIFEVLKKNIDALLTLSNNISKKAKSSYQSLDEHVRIIRELQD